jgi:superfamily II DNA or RNA helicase
MSVHEKNFVLTPKGYAIRKSALTEEQTKHLQTELMVTPKMNTKFVTKSAIAAATFKVYRESPQRWYVPRHWGQQTYGIAEECTVPEGKSLSAVAADFRGKPYEYQENIINTFIDAGANGLVCVPCGKGKTFMALAIAARLGKKFLVIVDKEFLMNQWRGEMQALLPGLRIGIIQEDVKQTSQEVIESKGPSVAELKKMAKEAGLKIGGTKEELIERLTAANVKVKEDAQVVEYDCCIAMIQTLIKRDFSSSEFVDFGFTIFDECHHLGAQYFSKVLQIVQTKHMLGLSATPTREDGLSKVFLWYLGDPVYWEKTREPDPTVEVKSVWVKTQDPVYHDVPMDFRNEVVMPRLLTNVLGCEDRNNEIVRWILKLCAESPIRKVLVLSERIGHLNILEEKVKGLQPDITLSYYVGGMKENVREEGAATARVLLASYAMASEAMNIKTLNAVILASPRKNVEQSTGRILRIRPEQRQVQPVIVDIVDEHSMYQGQWYKRLAYYRKCHYKIERWAHGADAGTTLKGAAASPQKEEAPVFKLNKNECLILDD